MVSCSFGLSLVWVVWIEVDLDQGLFKVSVGVCEESKGAGAGDGALQAVDWESLKDLWMDRRAGEDIFGSPIARELIGQLEVGAICDGVLASVDDCGLHLGSLGGMDHVMQFGRYEAQCQGLA